VSNGTEVKGVAGIVVWYENEIRRHKKSLSSKNKIYGKNRVGMKNVYVMKNTGKILLYSV
jgi:hypothetical protein